MTSVDGYTVNSNVPSAVDFAQYAQNTNDINAIATAMAEADAGAGDVLSGKKFIGANGSIETGTIANKGAITGSVGMGGTYSSTQNGYVTTIEVTGPTASGTYTYAANSTGETVDMGATNSYRYVNASNVYAKGKADGKANTSLTVGTSYYWKISGGSGKSYVEAGNQGVIYCVTDYYAQQTATLQGSNNASSWTTIVTAAGGSGNTCAIILGRHKGYKYYRVVVNGVNCPCGGIAAINI